MLSGAPKPSSKGTRSVWGIVPSTDQVHGAGFKGGAQAYCWQIQGMFPVTLHVSFSLNCFDILWGFLTLPEKRKRKKKKNLIVRKFLVNFFFRIKDVV